MIHPSICLNNTFSNHSIRPLRIRDFGDETESVCIFLYAACGVGAAAVAFISVHSDQYWMIDVYFAPRNVLQGGHILVGVQWNYTVVMIAC